MKTLVLPLCLLCLCKPARAEDAQNRVRNAVEALVKAENPPHFMQLKRWELWMASGWQPSEAEIGKEELGRIIKALYPSRPGGIILASAAVVPVDHAVSLSPAGLKAVTDKGIEVIPPTNLPGSLLAELGWSAEIEARYRKPRTSAEAWENIEIRATERKKDIEAERDFLDHGESHMTPENRLRMQAILKLRAMPKNDVKAIIEANALRLWSGSQFLRLDWIRRQEKAVLQINTIEKRGLLNIPREVIQEIFRRNRESSTIDFEIEVAGLVMMIQNYLDTGSIKDP